MNSSANPFTHIRILYRPLLYKSKIGKTRLLLKVKGFLGKKEIKFDT